MRIFGLEVTRSKTKPVDAGPKQAEDIEQKSSTWGKLFETGQNMGLFGGNLVTAPYKEIASVYKSVKAIADNIAQAQIIFVNKKGEEIDDPKLVERFARPNTGQSFNDFIQEWAGFYSLYGEAFVHFMAMTVGENAGTQLPALVNLNPKAMQETVINGVISKWRYSGQPPIEFIPEEIVHTKDFNPYNSFRGLSPLAPISDEIEIDQAIMTFNNAFFKNDAMLHVILATEKNLTEDQRNRIIEWMKKNHKGTNNAFRFDVFEGGLKPEVVSSNHKEMEFIEQKRLMREEIIGIWRSPKALFNITEDLNYATFMGQMKIFWIYTLMPILRKFEDSINAHYVHRYNSEVTLKFDYKNVPAFQEDFKEKVTTAQILAQIGFTGNEINEKLDLGFEEAEWRNEWWIGLGQVPASQAMMPPEDDPEEDPDKLADDNSEDDKKKDEEGKSAHIDVKKQAIVKSFLARQSALEERMASKVKRYFYELRNKVMTTADAELIKGQLSVDWGRQDDQLVKYTKPLIQLSIEQGIAHAEDVLGKKKDFKDDDLNAKLQSYLEIRADKITGINKTVQKQLKQIIDASVRDGGTQTEIASLIRDRVRGMFNNAGVRAKLIARTETAGGVNGGSLLFYQNEGVEKKEWLTAGDEFVRESHRRCQEQGAIDVEKPFSNGLMFPADQNAVEAGEVCNCRCTLAPVVTE
jgi:HK97 family phage portal protein